MAFVHKLTVSDSKSHCYCKVLDAVAAVCFWYQMEGGTFYKKGAEANLVNPSTKKGQKKSRQQSQQPQQPQPELNLNLR